MIALALAGALAIPLYAYLGYPALLAVAGAWPRRSTPATSSPRPSVWPSVSITLPVYNEEGQIRARLENLLALDYPSDRLQILVISDASVDETDAIVATFADRGVELLRLPSRRGKTAAENLSRQHVRGEIVVNTDASVRVHKDALQRMVVALQDPSVGVASCRVVSVGAEGETANLGDAGYVSYDMWVRRAETRVSGTVGASGCFFAMRAELHQAAMLPEALSCDFAAALTAREHGYRTVLVHDALCFVPRAPSLQREYQRKVRTMTRGMGTLVHKRKLLNPLEYGWFAWILFSHKVARWLVPWASVLALLALAVLSWSDPWARMTLAAALGFVLIGTLLVVREDGVRVSKLFSIPAYVVAANVAALHSTLRLLRGRFEASWEPTRRQRPVPLG